MDKLIVIKIGGNIIDDESKLSSFLKSFAIVSGKKILVHGGGKVATKIGEQLGIESKYVDGRRITDAATIDLVTMVYGGLINKKIVAQLQASNCNAIGVTGADANFIPATKRKVQNTPSGDGGIDYGFVGDVLSSQITASSWQLLLNNNLIPVVAPLTHDGKGQILNTNADTMAQEIAKALSSVYEVSLIYSFEKAGVLLDANEDSTVINKLNQEYYSQLKAEQKIFAGMIPKLDNAFAALNSGVKKVIIGKAEELNKLIDGETGTTIIND
jgi:acetylglutamate kinase